ncbi:MAG: hypothetical protein ACEQSR_01110 [Candidatus Methylacidiphilales bacterium]
MVKNGFQILLIVDSDYKSEPAGNFKSASNSYSFHTLRSTQQAWRITNTLGKTGANLLNSLKVFGAVGNSLSIGLKAYEIYDKGYANTRDISDLTVNSAAIVAFVFLGTNPIGWTIGAIALTYSTVTLINDTIK